MFVTGQRTEGQVVLLGKRTGEDIGTADTHGGSGGHIPPVVLLGIRAAPSYIGRYGIRRDTPFPTVTALDKSSAC